MLIPPSAAAGSEAATTADERGFAPRMLSRSEARMEQLLYWSRKSIPERLAAATALTRRMYTMRGINLDERKTDLPARLVPRRRG